MDTTEYPLTRLAAQVDFHLQRAEMFTAHAPRARNVAHAEIITIAAAQALAYADAIVAEHSPGA